MQSTRRLLTTASTTRALQGIKIPPRDPSETWSSALSACISFLDKKSRDNFIKTVNKGIINPPVLGQADGGFFSILALHHDLNSPLFRHSDKFDVEEFMDGVGSALENYEEVLSSLESRDFVSVDDDRIDDLSNASDSKFEEIEKVGENITDMRAEGTPAAIFAEAKAILAKEVDWNSMAEKSSESLEGQLATMVSEQCFKSLQREKRRILLQGNKRMEYVEDSSEVENVFLLSARAVEISPEDNDTTKTKILDGDENPMEDVSFSDDIEKEYPVVAQMEVLYSVDQTFVATPMFDTGSEEDKEEPTHQTVTSVWVGMFEGWIKDSASDALRWKLVKNRPALEFSGL